MTENELGESGHDHLTMLEKSALSAVLLPGSFLAEIAGILIPEQRVDRLVKYTKGLAQRLRGVDQQFLKN